VAEGKLVQRDGKRVVEQIVKVFSVDLVVQGATTRNVFESQADSSIPKPMESEKQFQFVPRCIKSVHGQNPSLSDEEAGAMCFIAWQSRYESGGMAADQHIPATTPKKESTVNTTGDMPSKERNPMNDVTAQIINDIEKQNQIRESASAFLDPNNADVVRRHMAEADHQAFEQARAQQAKDLRDQGRIEEQLRREGFSEPRNMMRESDRDFHNRLQEAQRRRDPLGNLTRSESATVASARSALTLSE
jgi:translation elongation factor EF-G